MRAEGDASCTPNIGARQRRRRFWPGVASLAAGLGLAGAGLGAPLVSPGHALAMVLVFGGFAGVFQSRDQT